MEPRVRLHFSSTMGDSRGDWVEQWAVLDRFRWPGLAVLRTRARYELLQQVSGSGGYESYTTTGFRFANRRELVQHLLRVQGTAQHSW
ncbi:hypothetical protein, partial [Listeria monocytogenes]|uniref:hypothetical protein n=1 Tax=Listeria monocytogenes TaxID=1639 RepID=UPI002FDC6A82